MQKSIAGFVILLMTAWATAASAAVVTYDYTGDSFTSISGTRWTSSDGITAAIEVDAPLPANLGTPSSLSDITGLAGFLLTMSAGSDTFSTAGSVTATVAVATDLAGQITHWRLSIDDNTTRVFFLSTNFISNNGNCNADDRAIDDTLPAPQNFSTAEVQYPSNGQASCASRAGDWVRTTPNGTSVPEPATALLLGAGLVGLGYARRRRKAA